MGTIHTKKKEKKAEKQSRNKEKQKERKKGKKKKAGKSRDTQEREKEKKQGHPRFCLEKSKRKKQGHPRFCLEKSRSTRSITCASSRMIPPGPVGLCRGSSSKATGESRDIYGHPKHVNDKWKIFFASYPRMAAERKTVFDIYPASQWYAMCTEP
jgi:outer membrane biosynthesis protein TonB